MTSPAPAHAGELPAVQCRIAASHAHTANLPTSLLPRAVAGADLTTMHTCRALANRHPASQRALDNTRLIPSRAP
jgi:hypothetical protein